MNFKILKIRKEHENFSDLDIFLAFYELYLKIAYLKTNDIIKKEITKEFIMLAISEVLLEIEDIKKIKHFLFSLCYKTEVKKNNDIFLILNKENLKYFKPQEILEIATENVFHLMNDDNFLRYIDPALTKKYESPQELIKTAYNLCLKKDLSFKEILLNLGLKND